jgi:hypothetical protein
MSRQFWSETITWATADGTAVANSTTEAILFPNITVPANFLQDGRVLRLTIYGRWSNVVTAVPTLTLKLRWGGVAGTIIAQTPAITTPAAATTSAPFKIEVTVQVRSNGASGTLFVMGEAVMTPGAAPVFGTVANYGLTALLSSTGTTVPAAVTVDLTADTALAVTAQWSAANAANSATGHIYTLEALN